MQTKQNPPKTGKTEKTIQIGNSTFKIVPFGHEFVFQCKNCGVCCRKIPIRLNPFDIILLCTKINIKTFQLHKLTRFSIDKKTNLPVCMLNTEPQCVFLSKEKKCLVYNERPFKCRGYPVGIHPDGYFLYHSPGCSANKLRQGETVEDKKIAVKDSLKKDEFAKYQKYDDEWKALINEVSKEYNPANENHQKFIKIAYDFDSKVLKKLTGKSLPKDADEKFSFIIEMAKKEFLK